MGNLSSESNLKQGNVLDTKMANTGFFYIKKNLESTQKFNSILAKKMFTFIGYVIVTHVCKKFVISWKIFLILG